MNTNFELGGASFLMFYRSSLSLTEPISSSLLKTPKSRGIIQLFSLANTLVPKKLSVESIRSSVSAQAKVFKGSPAGNIWCRQLQWITLQAVRSEMVFILLIL